MAHDEPAGLVQLIDAALFERVLAGARSSPRRRLNHNFHQRLDDNPHRFLNVLLAGTYVTPHRHLDPPKVEAFLVLEGQIAMFLFDDAGAVTAHHVLGRAPGDRATPLGIDLAPGIWHAIAPLTPHAVIYEVKPGPYRPADDKELAPWAPREGAPGCAEYAASLLARLPAARLGA